MPQGAQLEPPMNDTSAGKNRVEGEMVRMKTVCHGMSGALRPCVTATPLVVPL